MCHSCGSRNPGCLAPAPVFLLGQWELWDTFGIPAFAGMTRQVALTRPGLRPVRPPRRGEAAMLNSRLRGNDTLGLARQGIDRLLHSAKILRKF